MLIVNGSTTSRMVSSSVQVRTFFVHCLERSGLLRSIRKTLEDSASFLVLVPCVGIVFRLNIVRLVFTPTPSRTHKARGHGPETSYPKLVCNLSTRGTQWKRDRKAALRFFYGVSSSAYAKYNTETTATSEARCAQRGTGKVIQKTFRRTKTGGTQRRAKHRPIMCATLYMNRKQGVDIRVGTIRNI